MSGTPTLPNAVEALAHRIAWRYKKSSDPHHSDTYTFNKDTLLQFAAALASGATQPSNGTLIYGALTDKARARTSRENIDDVLDALAALATPPTGEPQ
ncbi:hypothetical protein [Variovorax sp. PAMC 28711]|uniref:hypothetical protein n=1 Tax=Variovorax sp. PAMC 28711 TaxID=1795631 RepID=UPI00078BC2F8|nr:hypothetical protein [Variovorax sp. PAMC 28711]AMM23027.1 hypothetical protein AX767_00490 [Variovorax sp. PAMC 28711]